MEKVCPSAVGGPTFGIPRGDVLVDLDLSMGEVDLSKTEGQVGNDGNEIT